MGIQAAILAESGTPFVGGVNIWPVTPSGLSVHALVRTDFALGDFNTVLLGQTDDFNAPTAGWSLGFANPNTIRAQVVNGAGNQRIDYDVQRFGTTADIGAFGTGSVTLISMVYLPASIGLLINGVDLGNTGLASQPAVNANVAAWAGAYDTAGLRMLREAGGLISLAVEFNNHVSVGDQVWRSALQQGFFDPALVDTDFIYNARSSSMRDASSWLTGTDATLFNEGTLANEAGFGDLTGATLNTSRPITFSSAIG